MRVQGSLSALLDSILGMNIELTGRENIMLRGLYSGLPRRALRTVGGRCRGIRRTWRFPRPAGADLLVRDGAAPGFRAGHSHPAADPADG